jgi:hypothetical protein
MLEKLAALAKTKAAIALVGVTLVGGAGATAAVAATTGHLNTLGINLNETQTNAQDQNSNHASVEGLLTGCTATSLTVKDKDGKSWTFTVNSSTKINGDVKSDAQGASTKGSDTGDSTGASSDSKGDSSSHAGDSTGDSHSGTHTGDSTGDSTSGTHTGDSTSGTHTGDSTGDSHAGGASSDKGSSSNAENGNHTATLAEICVAANLNTRGVQVQSVKNDTSVAAKVTLQGAYESSNGTDGASSDASAKGTETADPASTETKSGN